MSVFHVDAHSRRDTPEREYNTMVGNLAKINILEENTSQAKKDKIIQLAKCQKTGHARPAAMYRWACE